MQARCWGCHSEYKLTGIGNYFCPDCGTDLHTLTKTNISARNQLEAGGFTVTPLKNNPSDVPEDTSR